MLKTTLGILGIGLIGVTLLVGCGSSDGGGDLASGPGDLSAAVDGGGGGDLSTYVPAVDAGPLVCGDAGVCGSGNLCCVETPDSGAFPACVQTCTGGFPVSCAGPGYCGGNPCCLTLKSGKVQDVKCTSAPSDCMPTFTAGGDSMTRICDTDGDCTAGTSTIFDQCCHLKSNGYKICFSSGFVAASNGSIACP